MNTLVLHKVNFKRELIALVAIITVFSVLFGVSTVSTEAASNCIVKTCKVTYKNTVSHTSKIKRFSGTWLKVNQGIYKFWNTVTNKGSDHNWVLIQNTCPLRPPMSSCQFATPSKNANKAKPI